MYSGFQNDGFVIAVVMTLEQWKIAIKEKQKCQNVCYSNAMKCLVNFIHSFKKSSYKKYKGRCHYINV